VRKSDIFDAYLQDKLTSEQAAELKKILSTPDGSTEFMRYVSESYIICDLLQKRQGLDGDVESPIKKPVKFNRSWIFIAAVAACLLLMFFIKEPLRESPSITKVKIDETSVDGNPEKLTFRGNSFKEMTLVDGTLVQSNGQGEFIVLSKDKLAVKGGVFSFKVMPRKNKNDQPLRIQLTHGFVEVIGTEFEVMDTPEQSWVSLLEGKVRFVSAGKEYFLSPGETVEANSSQVVKEIEMNSKNLELSLDGSKLPGQNVYRDLSGNDRHGYAFNNVKQVDDEGNVAVGFTETGLLGIAKFPLENAFTLSTWVKPNGQTKYYQALIANGDDSWRLTMFESTLKAHFAVNDLTPEFINSTQELVANKWQFVTGVYDGATLKLYINGVLDSTAKVNGTVKQSAQNLEIAGNNGTHQRNFEGGMDGVQIYSRALSAMEIYQLFKKGRP
jgi:hypothetical protein